MSCGVIGPSGIVLEIPYCPNIQPGHDSRHAWCIRSRRSTAKEKSSLSNVLGFRNPPILLVVGSGNPKYAIEWLNEKINIMNENMKTLLADNSKLGDDVKDLLAKNDDTVNVIAFI